MPYALHRSTLVAARHVMHRGWLPLLALLVGACSPPPPEPVVEAEPSTGQEAPPPEVSIDGVDWKDMNSDQKAKYMEEVVMPTMKELFVAHDEAAYGESFGCATCHGNNATEVSFEMPNGLKPIDPKAFPTPASPNHRVAKWATFMFTKVTPKMVELLGAEPFDMEKQTGFGCFGCHGTKE